MLFLFGFNKNERFRSYSLVHNDIAIENYGTTEYEIQTQIPGKLSSLLHLNMFLRFKEPTKQFCFFLLLFQSMPIYLLAPPTVHGAKRTLTIPYEIRHATPPPDGLKRNNVNNKEIHDFDDIDIDIDHSAMDDFGNELNSTIGEEDSIKNRDNKNQPQVDMKDFDKINISDYFSDLSTSNNLTGFLTPVLLPKTTLQQPNNYR